MNNLPHIPASSAAANNNSSGRHHPESNSSTAPPSNGQRPHLVDYKNGIPSNNGGVVMARGGVAPPPSNNSNNRGLPPGSLASLASLPPQGHPSAPQGHPNAPQGHPSAPRGHPHQHPHQSHHPHHGPFPQHGGGGMPYSNQGPQSHLSAQQAHAHAQQTQPGWAVPNPLAQDNKQPMMHTSNPSYHRPSQVINTNNSQAKPRVVLSPAAREALAKAIWSAIRSPDGSIAPEAMAQALASGLPEHAVVNAARVAREREALKKKGLTPNINAAAAAVRPPQTKMPPPTMPTVMPPARPPPTKAATPPPVAVAPTKATLLANAKLEERTHWKRLHSGIFMVQKGRFVALPHSVGALIRTKDNRPAVSRRRTRSSLLSQAARIQLQLRAQPTTALPRAPAKSMTALWDPEKFKRVKIEPKRAAKALDRTLRKGRAATAEALLKQHKELSKAIVAHQTEFFKYHRQRRTEAHRLAKTVRDSLDKEERKKEKEADQAERARLAALRANDMAAYTKLLEETKNERLKFLLGKTDECITQISTLLQKRSYEDKNSAEFASASAASIGSYYASAHLKTEEVRQPSILVGGDLKEYQIAGLQWMISLYNNKLNGILADEMGLGKTIQAISLVSYLMEFKENLGPYLIIVPLSTLSNWVNEFAKWCPSAKVVIYKGTPAQRKDLYRDEVRNGHFNVLLTTYEYIIKDKASLRKLTWQYAIVDEGHRMKNAQSKFAVTLGTQYTTKNRILLTGTPLQNNLPELWALLNFLLPTIFNSVESFDQWFNRPFAQFGNSSGSDDPTDQMLTNEERMLIIHRLHELLRPFMLRRVKSEVLDQLPEKVEKVLRCELSSWQKELYKQISAKATADKSLLGTGFVEQPTRGLNNVVMQLRKVCNHPYLFSQEGYHINDNLIRSSGKMELLDQMLPKLKAAGHRVLMFTQMTAVMTILEDYFSYRGYTSLRLDGSTPAEEREKRMYQFNAPDSPYFIFLLSTRAGGLGLNLATANVVIIFDSDWNPMMDLQAQDRAHRIGQRSDVSVFRLVTNSPVEEKILSRATEKLNMSELVVEAGQFNKSSVENDNSLERRRLMEVLLTDFDSTNQQGNKTSDAADSDGDQDDDVDSESSDKEDLNELLSNNEADFELYSAIDAERSRRGIVGTGGLYTNPDDVPDWIRYPDGNKNGISSGAEALGDSRKRKAVAYDDGLTEKQFIRLMEKQADDEEATGRKRKAARMESDNYEVSSVEEVNRDVGTVASRPGTLTEWTFRKLINTCKTVIALKDPTTKRRLSEIFLEKPCAKTYPDYYELIDRPIAINDILRKCRGQLYADVQEFRDDWKVLLSNARRFNGEGSWVAVDAAALEKELERVMKKNGFEEPPPPPKRKPLRIKLSLKSLKTSVEPPPTTTASSPLNSPAKSKKGASAKKPKHGRRI